MHDFTLHTCLYMTRNMDKFKCPIKMGQPAISETAPLGGILKNICLARVRSFGTIPRLLYAKGPSLHPASKHKEESVSIFAVLCARGSPRRKGGVRKKITG